MSVDEAYLRSVRGRLMATTSGKWESFIEGRDHLSGSNFIKTDGNDIELLGATTADQDFIAHAHQDVEVLLNEVERLKKLLHGK